MNISSMKRQLKCTLAYETVMLEGIVYDVTVDPLHDSKTRS